MHRAGSFLLVSLMLVGSAGGEERSGWEGKRFGLAVTADLGNAKLAYEKMMTGRGATALLAKQTFREGTACSFDGVTGYYCRQDDPNTYLPPFPVALPYKFARETERVPIFGWAPVSKAVRGGELVSQWEKLATVGSVFDCEGATCATLVRGLPSPAENQEGILALCAVTKLKKGFGPPERCRAVAVTQGNESFISIVTGFTFRLGVGSTVVSFPPGRPDFRISIIRKPILEVSAVVSRMAKILAAAPLSLATDVGQERVIGSAQYRVSPFLPGHRELVTVRVDVRSSDEVEPPFVGMEIGLTLYVNRQNTDRPGDWHLPSPQQEAHYLGKIRGLLRSPLATLCGTAEWRGELILVCDMPPSTPLPPPLR